MFHSQLTPEMLAILKECVDDIVMKVRNHHRDSKMFRILVKLLPRGGAISEILALPPSATHNSRYSEASPINDQVRSGNLHVQKVDDGQQLGIIIIHEGREILDETALRHAVRSIISDQDFMRHLYFEPYIANLGGIESCFGSLRKLEPSRKILGALQQMMTVFSPQDASDFLLAAIANPVFSNSNADSSELVAWIKELKFSSSEEFVGDASSFVRFYSVYKSFSQGRSFTLPFINHRSVARWRTLLKLFPQMIQAMDYVLEHSDRFAQSSVEHALYVVSAASHSHNTILRDRAYKAISQFAHDHLAHGRNRRRFSFPEYCFFRTVRFCQAEADQMVNSREKLMNLVFSNRSTIELGTRYLRRYYGDDYINLPRHLASKVIRPTPRDEFLVSFFDRTMDILQ